MSTKTLPRNSKKKADAPDKEVASDNVDELPEENLPKAVPLQLIPCNQTLLVTCLGKREWDALRGEKPGPKKKGSLYIPETVDEEHDPDSMVIYDQGQVTHINEFEDVPFDVRVGDYIVFNHGAVVRWDKATNKKEKLVRFDQIIVIWRPTGTTPHQKSKGN